jgi:transglutaminase-like putative cysteine protease
MDLVIRHQTTNHYAPAASRVSLLLRLRPSAFDGQTVHQWGVSVNGEPVDGFVPNGYGDMVAHYYHPDPVEELIIAASGMVETQERAGVVGGMRREAPPAIFLRDTELTAPNAAIRALAQEAVGESQLAQMHSLSAIVNERVSYKTGSTSVESTAIEALSHGFGVCQDQSHVFVSAARTLGIPARYVVGYFLDDTSDVALHETHAWAEAHIEGLGWVGFDSTNCVCPTAHYVRLCCGMDAHDASPIRGSVFGGAQMAIDADVAISEASGDLQQQMQQQQ